jgi:hypothetical protein
MTTHLPLLTTSSARAYRLCPRYYALTYEQGYRSVHTSDALSFGDLVHRALEQWWLAAQRGDPADAWLSHALSALASEEDPYTRARAHALLVGYHARWSDLTWQGEPLRVLAVEREFVGPLLNPETGAPSRTWLRAGKLDAVVEAGRHGVLVVEHKTTSEDITPGSTYWRRLTMDSQVSNYHVGARLLSYEPSGVLYDVIKKPSLKPQMATPEAQRNYTKPTKANPVPRLYAGQRAEDESPEDYYARILDDIAAPADADKPSGLERYYARAEIVRLAEEEREAAFDVWRTGVEIREARRLQVWPRNVDACHRWQRPCTFFDVCSGAASLDDPTRFRRTDNPHEELHQITARAADVAA